MLLPVSLLTVSNSLILVNCEKCILNFTYTFKGYACYIFTGFFCMSKREHLWNKEKCFLFHFKSSCCSWHNQLWTYYVFHIMMSSNAKVWNTKHMVLNNLGSKHHLLIKFGQFMQYYKIFFFSKNSTKNVARKLVPGPF